MAPILIEKIYKRIASDSDSESFLGDVEELLQDLRQSKGPLYCNLWMGVQVSKSIFNHLYVRAKWRMTMLQHQMKISMRNLLKQKGYSFINIAGLAVGIALCILIVLYIQYELSYDSFHEKVDRVYRFAVESRTPNSTRLWGWTSVPMADQLESEFPEVERATRILSEMGETQILFQQKGFIEDKVLYSDPRFFDLFTVPLISGDPQTALKDPHTVVISQSAARRYFGDADPMGKVVQIRNWYSDNQDHFITGVARDIPHNTHFHFDFLISYSSSRVSESTNWGYWQVFNYVLLREGADRDAFEAKIPDFVKRQIKAGMDADRLASYEDYLAQGYGPRLFLQPLQQIHLKSHLEHEIEPNGNIAYIRMFSIIAVLILMIACVNFMNLSTARSANRAREVGIRKTLGSDRRQLVQQFLIESILLCFLSMILAWIVVSCVLPVFRIFAGIGKHAGSWNAWLWPGTLLFTLGIGLLSGSYPALFLSSFQPMHVLKNLKSSGSQGRHVRNGLVLFQFTASICLIACTWVIKDQIHFMVNTNLGCDKEHVIVLSNGRALQDHFDAFRNELLRDPAVTDASVSGQYPAQANHVANYQARNSTSQGSVSIFNSSIGHDFIKTMGMEILQGRDFSRAMSTDTVAVLLNESAVRALGIQEPIGTILDSFRTFTVIGVVRDFHFRSLHYPVAPLLYHLYRANRFDFIAIRIQGRDMAQTISRIQTLWNRFTDEQPFLCTFLDETIGRLYQSEQKTSQITTIFSGLAILIACLGLFGLAAYTAEQKTKEVGIRKVLGASAIKIFFHLSRESTKWVVLANIIAWPVAFFVMNRWLQDYAYRVSPKIWIFILSGLTALAIALLTVSVQSIKAARANPAESLKYE